MLHFRVTTIALCLALPGVTQAQPGRSATQNAPERSWRIALIGIVGMTSAETTTHYISRESGPDSPQSQRDSVGRMAGGVSLMHSFEETIFAAGGFIERGATKTPMLFRDELETTPYTWLGPQLALLPGPSSSGAFALVRGGPALSGEDSYFAAAARAGYQVAVSRSAGLRVGLELSLFRWREVEQADFGDYQYKVDRLGASVVTELIF